MSKKLKRDNHKTEVKLYKQTTYISYNEIQYNVFQNK